MLGEGLITLTVLPLVSRQILIVDQNLIFRNQPSRSIETPKGTPSRTEDPRPVIFPRKSNLSIKRQSLSGNKKSRKAVHESLQLSKTSRAHTKVNDCKNSVMHKDVVLSLEYNHEVEITATIESRTGFTVRFQ